MNTVQKSVIAAVFAVTIGLAGCSSSTPAEPLADDVWAQVEANFPEGIPTSNVLFAVTDVEDVSNGTIRVYVQQNLDDEGREDAARGVFNMGALKNEALTTVVIQDATGKDSNHRR